MARREFETLQRLQKSPWLPSLMDSFQEASSYPGGLYFFFFFDTEAPSLAERAKDVEWKIPERVRVAGRCVEALLDLHQREAPAPDEPVLHRNLNPESIRIRSNDEPLLTQLHLAKLPGAVTVSGTARVDFKGMERFVAPEVLNTGIGASTPESDVYALCSSLSLLFEGKPDDPDALRARAVLAEGLDRDAARRIKLETLLEKLQPVPELHVTPTRRLPVQSGMRTQSKSSTAATTESSTGSVLAAWVLRSR